MDCKTLGMSQLTNHLVASIAFVWLASFGSVGCANTGKPATQGSKEDHQQRRTTNNESASESGEGEPTSNRTTPTLDEKVAAPLSVLLTACDSSGREHLWLCESPAPKIDSITPASPTPGETIRIHGSGFGTRKGTSWVRVAAQPFKARDQTPKFWVLRHRRVNQGVCSLPCLASGSW